MNSEIGETPGKFAMKGFDSSSEEEEDDNMGLLELDSDEDQEIENLKTPKLSHSSKKKDVSERRVILMSAFIAICGKQRASKIIHASQNAKYALFQTFSFVVVLVLFISICFFLVKLFHHHVVLQNKNQIYHTMMNDFMSAHQNLS